MTRFTTGASSWALCITALAMVLPTTLLIESGAITSLGGPLGAPAFLPLLAILLAEPIRTGSWRRALSLCALAGSICMLKAMMNSRMESVPYPFDLVSWDALLIGIGYWLVTPPLNVCALGFMLSSTAAVACALPSIVQPVRYMHWVVHLPIAGGHRTTDLIYALYWCLLAIGAWVAITTTRSWSRAQSRGALFSASIVVCLSLAWFLFFFQIAVFALAAQSLVRGFPFDRNYAALVLQRRLDAATAQLLWQAITSADWSARPTNDKFDDYRRTCILVLDEHAPTSTAAGLETLLRRRPSFWLADYSAPVLARGHRYGAGPELMRYALLDDSESTSALEQMGIPQAAMAVLHEQISTETMVTGRPETMGAPIGADYERRLTRLLGVDAGTKLSDWFALYDKAVDKHPSPFSIQQKSETDRVVRAFFAYWSASDQLQQIGRLGSIPAPDFNVPGTRALESEVQRYASAALAAGKR